MHKGFMKKIDLIRKRIDDILERNHLENLEELLQKIGRIELEN